MDNGLALLMLVALQGAGKMPVSDCSSSATPASIRSTQITRCSPRKSRAEQPLAGHAQSAIPANLPRVSEAQRNRYAPIVRRVASRYKVDAALLLAVISAESRFDQYAVSPRGAVGLMQITEANFDRYGVTDPFDAQQNISAGARHLAYLLRLFGNNISLALAAYNAGHGTVMRYGNTIPPYPETRNYVPKVLGYYHKYRAGI